MEEEPADWKGLLGRKVSVRYRLESDPHHQFSEAIGVVMGVAGSERGDLVKIMTRRGREVVVNAADVVACKTFPTS